MYRAFWRKYGWIYVPGILLAVFCSYLQTVSPLVLGAIFDLFDAEVIDRTAVMNKALMLIWLALAVFVLRFAWRSLLMGNARVMESMLRRQLLEHFQSMPASFYNKRKTGDLIAYAVNDLSAVRMTYSTALSLGVQSVVTCAASIASMFTQLNPRLTLFALLPLPFAVFFILQIGGQVKQRFAIVQQTFAEVSDRVNENVGGIRVVKAYVQEKSEIERFETLNCKMRDSSVNMVRVSALVHPMIQVLFGVSFTVGLIYGGYLVRSGLISVGDFVAFNSFLTLIMRPVENVGRITTMIQRGRASSKRLQNLMDQTSDVPEGTRELESYRGELEVRDLTFTFPGETQPALKHINLKLEPGKTLGIIGHTGSGKTALAQALMKVYAVPDGMVFLDGVDINELTLTSLRKPFGYVPQDGFLFSDTVKNNILFYDEKAGEKELEKALEDADLTEIVHEFPNGVDTMLGDRGVNLSGGQKQRIEIARALVKNPTIYLFDDALAAVDTRTEERILSHLRASTQGKTAIWIAHRASVIKDADEIIMLENGEIAERGTHEQLLAMNGKYAALWRIQSGKGEEDDENAFER